MRCLLLIRSRQTSRTELGDAEFAGGVFGFVLQIVHLHGVLSLVVQGRVPDGQRVAQSAAVHLTDKAKPIFRSKLVLVMKETVFILCG